MIRRLGDSTVLVGEGKMADAIFTTWQFRAGELGTALCDSTVRQVMENFYFHKTLAVVVEDELTSGSTHLQTFRDTGATVLSVSGRMNRVFVGPLEAPNRLGCSSCVDLRWMNSIRLAPLELDTKIAAGYPVTLPLFVTEQDLGVISEFVINEVLKIGIGQPSKLDGHVAVLQAGKAAVELKTVIPHEGCPRCKELCIREFRESSDITTFKSQSLALTNSIRVKDLNLKDLRRWFVDTDVGCISAVGAKTHDSCYVSVKAHVKLSAGRLVSGFGAAFTRDEAEKTAILEALERLCGRYPSVRQESFLATYNDTRCATMHPILFGLHDDSVYDEPRNQYRRFSEDREYHWVHGYSCGRGVNVAVPEQLAYHRQERPGEPKFVQQTSNGCAIGGSTEEAVLYGLLEVIERDAFLNTWYAKLSLPEIRVDDETFQDAMRWVTTLRRRGYDVRIFDMSHDLSVPCILAVAVNEHDEFPKVVCGSAAHLRRGVAIEKAVRELVVQVFSLTALSPADVAGAQEKSYESSKIRTIRDHKIVGALPESEGRWSFLFADADRCISPSRAFIDPTKVFEIESNDIRVILERVLSHVFDHGFDVIVVPQTRIELKYAGLEAVRVLIPGMLPMTFGHEFRRIQGLDRVLSLPHKLGQTDRRLRMEELNADPHPFA